MFVFFSFSSCSSSSSKTKRDRNEVGKVANTYSAQEVLRDGTLPSGSPSFSSPSFCSSCSKSIMYSSMFEFHGGPSRGNFRVCVAERKGYGGGKDGSKEDVVIHGGWRRRRKRGVGEEVGEREPSFASPGTVREEIRNRAVSEIEGQRRLELNGEEIGNGGQALPQRKL
ncbi:unnamed protein product [Linum trigynum]|uniref:Uncharacterized protein n=1 Tax=Linum trigynum TaxID=586398 RepID=A0AAV2D0J8_9ROSI